MKIKHYQQTDTLYIELRSVEVAETRDLDENTLLDLDRDGKLCGITIEHASQRVDIPDFSFEQFWPTELGTSLCHFSGGSILIDHSPVARGEVPFRFGKLI
jgi:uncharacterized protein YuzE